MPRLRPLEPSIAIREVDLTVPLSALTDVTGATQTRIAVRAGARLLGHVTIQNGCRAISVNELRDAIAAQVGEALLQRNEIEENVRDSFWNVLHEAIRVDDAEPPAPVTLPAAVPVCVAVCTYDRPDDLARCLTSLVDQAAATARPVDLLVVDNHPASGLTSPVVDAFPSVRYVAEERAGLAYARNAGFLAARGDICVMTDDDVTFPPGWLEQLLAPFARHDVMVVTGNVLPGELDTEAQQLFEIYGGLGRGTRRYVVDRSWLASYRRTAAPTWMLGATANAAIRLSVFDDGAVSTMHEALGPGTPAGVGEDTYLFYQILKAGYALVYEPSAFVWHRHRRTPEALQKQLYNYSKGHVAYHLVTLLEAGDVRAVVRCLKELPKAYVQRTVARLRGHSAYPLRLLAVELAGTLAGPWALWRSYRRRRRLGPSRTRRETGRSQPKNVLQKAKARVSDPA